jgi:hypothetical protein
MGYEPAPNSGADAQELFTYQCVWPEFTSVGPPAHCVPKLCTTLETNLYSWLASTDPRSLRAEGFNLTFETGARQEGKIDLRDSEIGRGAAFFAHSCFKLFDYGDEEAS